MESRAYGKRREHRLHNAVILGWPGAVRRMLRDGADPNAPGKYGYTPLMLAAMWRRTEIAALLLGAGAEVNARARDGATALMPVPAEESGVRQLLLAHGAESVPDAAGSTT